MLGGRLEKFTSRELRAKLRSGELDRDEKGWKGGLDGWKSLSTFSELHRDDGDDDEAPAAPAPAGPPPLPRRPR